MTTRDQLLALVGEFPGLSLDAVELLAMLDDRIGDLRQQEAKNRQLLEIKGPTDDHTRGLANQLGKQAEALEALRQQFVAHRRVRESLADIEAVLGDAG